MQDRLFTPEQLAEATRPLCDLAARALDAGDPPRLRFLLGRMSVGHFELYYGYVHWLARLAGKLLRDRGEACLESLLSQVTRYIVDPLAADLQGEDGEKRAIAGLLSLWSVQLAPLTLAAETPEEVAVVLAPCGSGGRLLLEGWDHLAPRSYPRTSAGTPVLCRVCERFRRAVNEAAGRPFWSAEPCEGRPGFCRMVFRKARGHGERLFSREELRSCTTPRCARALARLDQGRSDVRELLAGQHREWRPLHDLFCLFVTAVFSWTDREQGPAYLSELVDETYVTLFEMPYITHGLMDDRSLVTTLARNWHYHQASFHVTEEDDRFVFHLDPCGSGGRLNRGELGGIGRYPYGKGMLRQIDRPHPMTFMRAPFPSYCIHCGATNRDQLLGKPWAFLVDGDAPGPPSWPCRQYLYKKNAPRVAPGRLLEQAGLTRAGPLKKGYHP